MNFKTKKCIECGKEFLPRCGTQVYCDGPHVAVCQYCGKEFEYMTSPKFKRAYCSAECRELGKQKMLMDKYGVDNVARIDSVAGKISSVKRGESDKSRYIPVVTTKRCAYCGKEFVARGTKRYCDNKHYAKCEVCGKDFEVNPAKPIRFCSSDCRYIYKLSSMPTKQCEWCGKEFHPMVDAQRYCDGPHYSNCPICGKQMVVPKGLEYTFPKPCSSGCSVKMRRQTCIDRYGVYVASQSEQAREKLRAHSGMIGDKNPAKRDVVRARIRDSVMGDDCQARSSDVMYSKYGVRYAMQNEELFKKQAASRGSHYAKDGTHVDSSWEEIVYNFLVDSRVPFQYQYPIEYELCGTHHVTYVDFNVGGILFEVKGNHLLEGCFDYRGVPIAAKLDVYRKHDVVIITEGNYSSLFSPSEPCHLRGVDIKAFQCESASWSNLLAAIVNYSGFISKF